ncbi:MAG TPA: type II secretion system protein [Candidatus Omnitrophota bacterium]|nr:type II secretion system protein [Candidatus Omnitrophota bacterium]
MNLKTNKAVTLVEMIVTLVIGTLLIFILGSFIGLSSRSYSSTVRESSVNSSLMYGLKLIQNRVHKSKFLEEQAVAGQWLSEQLICNNEFAFGIYQASGSATKDFVYLPDINDETNRQVILAVPLADTLDFSVTINGRAVTITVWGTKGDVPFNLTSTVLRRS